MSDPAPPAGPGSPDPRVNPRAVDVRHGDACQSYAGRQGDESLDTGVIQVVVLEARGRLHLDHLPSAFAGAGYRQQDISECEGSLGAEAGLENRRPAPKQLQGPGQRGVIALDVVRVREFLLANAEV